MKCMLAALLLTLLCPLSAEEGGAIETLEQPHQAVARAVMMGERGQLEGVIIKPAPGKKAATETSDGNVSGDRYERDVAEQLAALKHIADERGLSAASAKISLSGLYTQTRPWSWVPVSEGRVKYKFAPWLWRAAIVGEGGKTLSLVYGIGYRKEGFLLSTPLSENVLSDQDWAMISLW